MQVRIRRGLIFPFAVFFGLSVVSVCVAQQPLQQKLQTLLGQIREQAGYPGVTAAVALPDGEIVAAAAGWSDPVNHTAMQPTDRMLAGSVGKTFVAAAILQAVDDGKLDLDIKVEKWIGNEPWFGRIPNAHELTLRLLLSHRSGVPDYVESKEFSSALTHDFEKEWTADELVAFALDRKPMFPAGKKYSYADANYVLAGAIFEHATGEKLFAAIEKRIVQRFRLEATSPTRAGANAGLIPGALELRSPVKGKRSSLQDGRLVYNAQAEYAGGGMVSNAPDLARWAWLLWQGRVFSDHRLADMLDGKPAEKGNLYGLATDIVQTGAGPAYGHDGLIFGYQTAIIYIPKLKMAAAVQVNSDKDFKMPVGNVLGKVLSLALHRDDKPGN
jgi:D-alanyl-D-alanine carboxypeptidase